MSEINDLIYLSKYFGNRFDCIQAGGGNISVKNQEKTYIKSSGSLLSDINKSSGYVELDTKQFNLDMTTADHNNFKDILSSYSNKLNEPPSIETPLHTQIKAKYVVHLHPYVLLSVLAAQNGESIINEKIEKDGVWINYSRPGIQLAKQIHSIGANISYKPIFLENHGVIIMDESIGSLLEKTESLLQKFESHLGYKNPYRKLSKIQNEIFLSTSQMYLLQELETETDLKNINHLSPDDAVYLDTELLVIENCLKTEIIHYMQKNTTVPSVILLNNTFYIIGESRLDLFKKTQQLTSNLLASNLQISNNLIPRSISKEEVVQIKDWDVEVLRYKK